MILANGLILELKTHVATLDVITYIVVVIFFINRKDT